MEEFKKLIKLCQRRKRYEPLGKQIFSAPDYREILKLAEELNVIGIYDDNGRIEVQLSNLENLLLLDIKPTKEIENEAYDSNYVWTRYATEINGIVFFDLELELKEEHKKAQAI